MDDKRRNPRRKRRFRVTVGEHSWFTTDVGQGGFGTEAARAPLPGTKVAGLIHGKGVEVPFAGQVIWALRGNMHMNMRGRAGVRFIRVGPTMGSLIDDP